MGLFDLFTGKKSPEAAKKKTEREIARLARLVGEKMTQNFDRQEAIEQLSAMGTGQSAAALLKRFTWSMDPSITDHEEKDAAARGVVAAGDAALEPLRAFCVKADSLTWPIKMLKQIVSEDDIVDELLGILDEFDTEYVRNIEPKKQLLSALEVFKCDDVREAVEPFLTDISEPVRYAAVTTTFAMQDSRSVSALVEAMAEEESLRVRNRIAQGIAEAGWEVPKDLREVLTEHLPPDFQLESGKIVRVA
jgi:HEAT repeat protein